MNMLLFLILSTFLSTKVNGGIENFNLTRLYTVTTPIDHTCTMYGRDYNLGKYWPDSRHCIVYQCRLMAIRLLRNGLFHMPFAYGCANMSLDEDPNCVKLDKVTTDSKHFQPYPMCCPTIICTRETALELQMTALPDYMPYKPDYEKFKRDFRIFVKDQILSILGIQHYKTNSTEDEDKTLLEE